MAKGFIFNSNLCVNCRSCSAACMLENGFSHPVRRIFVHNPDAYLPEPVINISMACNHCGETPCVTGCPASALRKDPVTGAVIVDDTKCIGCRFCIWNCPWDAPKFNEKTGTIEKCTFCTHLLEEGRAPACTNACPTMALRFGEIVQTENDEAAVILPAVDINPSAEIRVKGNSLPETIPARNEIIAWETEGKSLSDDVEWSLLVFSFLSVISEITPCCNQLPSMSIVFPDSTELNCMLFVDAPAKVIFVNKVLPISTFVLVAVFSIMIPVVELKVPPVTVYVPPSICKSLILILPLKTKFEEEFPARYNPLLKF